MIQLLAILFGSLGAVLRYLVSGLVQERVRHDFPVGTLAVNLVGAFALGLLVGSGADLESPVIVSLVGLLGGFTTFSTWMVETLGLGPWSVRAAMNLVVMLLGGVLAAAVGFIVS